jgi:hypothetical protein
MGDANTDRPYISSPEANPQEEKDGDGAQLYAAALDLSHNNRKQIKDDWRGLSPINTSAALELLCLGPALGHDEAPGASRRSRHRSMGRRGHRGLRGLGPEGNGERVCCGSKSEGMDIQFRVG